MTTVSDFLPRHKRTSANVQPYRVRPLVKLRRLLYNFLIFLSNQQPFKKSSKLCIQSASQSKKFFKILSNFQIIKNFLKKHLTFSEKCAIVVTIISGIGPKSRFPVLMRLASRFVWILGFVARGN